MFIALIMLFSISHAYDFQVNIGYHPPAKISTNRHNHSFKALHGQSVGAEINFYTKKGTLGLGTEYHYPRDAEGDSGSTTFSLVSGYYYQTYVYHTKHISPFIGYQLGIAYIDGLSNLENGDPLYPAPFFGYLAGFDYQDIVLRVHSRIYHADTKGKDNTDYKVRDIRLSLGFKL